MVEIVDSGNVVYDIHNCYDLHSIRLTSQNEVSELEIIFIKTKGEWVKAIDPDKVTLLFNNLKFVEFSNLFFAEFSSNVEEMGYKDPQDKDYMWLMGEEHFTGEQHFVLRLENSEHIRIYSSEVKLLIDDVNR